MRGPADLLETAMPRRWGRNFRPLLGSSWATNLGDGILLVSTPLLIESLTDDAFLVGISWLLTRLPWLLVALPAGVMADRLDRRRLIMAANATRIVLLSALALGVATETITVAVALALVFVIGIAEVFADTTGSTLLPMIVPSSDLGAANTRFVFGTITINRLIGPAVGATLFAASSTVPFAAAVITMAAGVVLVSRLRLTRQEIDETRASDLRSQIADGFRWLQQHPPLRTLALTGFVFNLTFGASASVLVVLAGDRLGLDAIGFGALTAMAAAGGILGTFLYARIDARVGAAWIMRVGLAIETFHHLVLATATTAWPAFVAMFVFGIHEAMWATTATTVRQRAVPEQLQGRVSSVYRFAGVGGLIIGAGAGAVLAGRVGITAPYWFAFFGSAVTLVAIWRTLGLLATEPQDR